MTHTAFFDLVRQTAHAALNGFQQPTLGGKLLTHLKIIAKCFVGDEVVTVDADTAEFLILAKTSASGEASLIDTIAVLNTSDPAEPQYEFEWNPADSIQLRAVLDAAADPTAPVELRYEFRFERSGQKGCIGGPIYFLNNFFRPETAAPLATSDTTWELLKTTIQPGTHMTRTVNDTTKVMTLNVTAGADADDGSSVELQVTATHIQWRLIGAPTWTNLIALTEITGPAGADGADGVDGAPGADGGTAEIRDVIFVETDGDDDTGQVGNPALPFQTAQAAYEAWLSNGGGTLVFGAGSFGDIDLSAGSATWLRLRGNGGPMSAIIDNIFLHGFQLRLAGEVNVTVTAIYASGTAGVGGSSPGESGTDGGDTAQLTMQGVLFLHLYAVGGAGGNGVTGADGTEGDPSGSGGNGGIGGDLKPILLFDCTQYDSTGALMIQQGFGAGAGNAGADLGGGVGSAGTPGGHGSFGTIKFVRCNLRNPDSQGISPAPTADTFMCLMGGFNNGFNHNGNGTTVGSWPELF